MVDRLKTEYEGIVEFRLINVEADPQGPTLMAQYNAQYVPTFVFLNTDGSQSAIVVGAQSEDVLRSALDELK